MLIESLLALLSGISFLALNVSTGGHFPPPFSKEKEKEYLKRMKDGDEDAKKELIEHNLRLVAHIVKKYYGSPAEQEDLISIGTIGLIKAVSSYNENKGIKLATYASRCIENEILMYFRNLKKSANDVHINDTIDSDGEGNSLTLADILADDVDIVGDLDMKFKLEKLKKAIDQVLDDRERKIIKMRYGLDGSGELPQREVAVKLHISRSYVSRIEKKALEKLRECF